MQVPKSYLKDEEVHKLSLQLLLENVPLPMDSCHYTAGSIYNVILAAATEQSSIDAVCGQTAAAPCANTVRSMLYQGLDAQKLEAQLNALLIARLPKILPGSARRVAIDLHLVPYHGQPQKDENEIRRSQAKSGTTHFHAYATLYAIIHGKRSTFALSWVHGDEQLTDILQRLLASFFQLGLELECLLLDRQFFTVQVIRYLQRKGYPFIMPVILRGKNDPLCPGGTRALVAGKSKGYRTSYTMRSQEHGSVTFQVAVSAQNQNGRQGPSGRRLLCYAVAGLDYSLTEIREIYRKRFGIESSYRQLNSARARTSSRSPLLRLFYVGVGLLLRNLWVWLRWAVLAKPRRGGRQINPHLFPLRQMLRWIRKVAQKLLQDIDHLSAFQPIPVLRSAKGP